MGSDDTRPINMENPNARPAIECLTRPVPPSCSSRPPDRFQIATSRQVAALSAETSERGAECRTLGDLRIPATPIIKTVSKKSRYSLSEF